MFGFKSFRASMKSMFETTDKMLEEMEEVEDQLDFDLKDVPPGTSKEVVREETRPDGTKIVTRTILRTK